MHRLSG